MSIIPVVTRRISTGCTYQSIDIVFHSWFSSTPSINLKRKFYLSTVDCSLPFSKLLSEQKRTTFADIKPIEIENFLANNVANFLNQDFNGFNQSINELTTNVSVDNLQSYPILDGAKDAFKHNSCIEAQVISANKTFPYTMTYAGKTNIKI